MNLVSILSMIYYVFVLPSILVLVYVLDSSLYSILIRTTVYIPKKRRRKRPTLTHCR